MFFHFVQKSVELFAALHVIQFYVLVLINEVSNIHNLTISLHAHLPVLINLDVHLFRSKFINAFTQPLEQNLHPIILRHTVDELSQCLVDWVARLRDIQVEQCVNFERGADVILP